MVAKVILPPSNSPPHPGDTSQAAKIKERIRRWRAAELRALREEALVQSRQGEEERRKSYRKKLPRKSEMKGGAADLSEKENTPMQQQL